MKIRRLFEGIIHYPTEEELAMYEKQFEHDMRDPDDKFPEVLYSKEMHAAWKRLSRDERIDVLDMLVGEGAVDDEALIALFPKIAAIDDIADFNACGGTASDMRDCHLRWAFDQESSAFTVEHYRQEFADWMKDIHRLAMLINS